uniref:hypothetical protein n=1 Tax=Leptospirillum ferrooxidans TaxID=180 RepID=UPI001568AC45|nr:hypothetical protein [Leptospirillum ferrooxidans]
MSARSKEAVSVPGFKPREVEGAAQEAPVVLGGLGVGVLELFQEERFLEREPPVRCLDESLGGPGVACIVASRHAQSGQLAGIHPVAPGREPLSQRVVHGEEVDPDPIFEVDRKGVGQCSGVHAAETCRGHDGEQSAGHTGVVDVPRGVKYQGPCRGVSVVVDLEPGAGKGRGRRDVDQEILEIGTLGRRPEDLSGRGLGRLGGQGGVRIVRGA